MAFIKNRKKIVSSALLSVMASATMADEVALDTIHTQAEAESQASFKVEQSKNSKFVAPLLDTPKSVAVISKQLMQDTQVTSLTDALRTVPGITLGAGEGGNPNGDRPFIRGYNSESSMYVDGIRSATSQNRDMFAVEQVEVTKGSASAMGGAGTTGGSINMVFKVAKAGDALEGSVAAGTDNYQRITLDANKDFGNGIAARVAVLGHHNEKAGQNDGAEYKRAGIAPSISWGLESDTRGTLSYYHLQSDDTPDAGVPFNYTKNPITGKNGTYGKPVQVPQGIYYGWLDRDFQKQENHIGSLKLEHDLNEQLTISNTAVYSRSKNDYIWTQPDDSKGNVVNGQVWRRANSRITDTTTFTNQLALTGKFKTGTLSHKFNMGAEYSKQETDKGNYSISSASGSAIDTNACKLGLGAASNGWCTSLYTPNSHDAFNDIIKANRATTYINTDSSSVYLLDNIEINPQWLLDLGVRWDEFDTKGSVTERGSSTPVKVSNKDDFINYQIGLTYKPVERAAIYASFTTASNPVGDFGDGSESISVASQNLKPEEVRTMELGSKWDLFDRRANFTAAIFRTEKTNTRVNDDESISRNIGETRVDGIELGLSGNITDAWVVSAGYTYLDAEIIDGGYVSGSPTGSVNGNQTPTTPKHSATLWTTYAIDSQFTLGAGATYMDKVYADNTNYRWAPAYTRFDAMARYNVNQNVDLQLNLNNLSDKRYFTKLSSPHYTTEAEGRNAVLSLNFKY